MYDDFYVTDRWTRQPVHCIYQALIMAIATRHADAIDVKFLVEGKPVWLALPHPAWVEYQRLTSEVVNDPLAVQTAGHYLKTAIEAGLDTGREMYTLSVAETLHHMREVLVESKAPDFFIPDLDAASA